MKQYIYHLFFDCPPPPPLRLQCFPTSLLPPSSWKSNEYMPNLHITYPITNPTSTNKMYKKLPKLTQFITR